MHKVIIFIEKKIKLVNYKGETEPPTPAPQISSVDKITFLIRIAQM